MQRVKILAVLSLSVVLVGILLIDYHNNAAGALAAASAQTATFPLDSGGVISRAEQITQTVTLTPTRQLRRTSTPTAPQPSVGPIVAPALPNGGANGSTLASSLVLVAFLAIVAGALLFWLSKRSRQD